MNKAMMTESQVYAVKSADEKLIKARIELQKIVNIVAKELNRDTVKETWILSKDMKSLERVDDLKLVEK